MFQYTCNLVKFEKRPENSYRKLSHMYLKQAYIRYLLLRYFQMQIQFQSSNFSLNLLGQYIGNDPTMTIKEMPCENLMSFDDVIISSHILFTFIVDFLTLLCLHLLVLSSLFIFLPSISMYHSNSFLIS